MCRSNVHTINYLNKIISLLINFDLLNLKQTEGILQQSKNKLHPVLNFF